MRKTPPMVVLAPLDRNALEGFLLAACVITGLTRLTGVVPYDHIGVPVAFNILWNAMLIVGGSGALTGMFLQNRLIGTLVLRAFLLILGASALARGAAILYNDQRPPTVVSGFILVLLAVAVFWRAIQIGRASKFWIGIAPEEPEPPPTEDEPPPIEDE